MLLCPAIFISFHISLSTWEGVGTITYQSLTICSIENTSLSTSLSLSFMSIWVRWRDFITVQVAVVLVGYHVGVVILWPGLVIVLISLRVRGASCCLLGSSPLDLSLWESCRCGSPRAAVSFPLNGLVTVWTCRHIDLSPYGNAAVAVELIAASPSTSAFRRECAPLFLFEFLFRLRLSTLNKIASWGLSP